MKTFYLKAGLLTLSLAALSSCGQQSQAALEQECTLGKCSEKEINAPVAPEVPAPPSSSPVAPSADYRFPEFDPEWKMGRATYEKMIAYYHKHFASLPNPRYATIIDFSQPMSHMRFYLFDLKNGTVERHVTSHGKNSDPDNDGFATEFSNTVNSLQSSLGFYLTLATYKGAHGYSLRLRGLEDTNDNAEERAIVMHPADYVSDKNNYAGRSWGCPALDPKISKKVIDRVKDGSLILIDYDPSEARKR